MRIRRDDSIQTRTESENIALEVLKQGIQLSFPQSRVLFQTVQTLASKIGAEVIGSNSSIKLVKEINGREWNVLTINHEQKTIDIVVDVKTCKGKESIATGITSADIYVPGYTVRSIHEVRGKMERCLQEGGRVISRADGSSVFVEHVLREKTLPNGDIVRYNTWDFCPYAIFRSTLTDATIACESPEHKREFVLQLSDAFCGGEPSLQGVFSTELEQRLRKIHETRKAPAYLSGYEIHHDGYGEMLLLPKDIHCRKLPHIGGSWLMNTNNYAIYLTNPSQQDIGVQKILQKELTLESFEKFAHMPIEMKEAYVTTIGTRILEKLGLGTIKIEIVDLDVDLDVMTCGGYSSAESKILISKRLLESSNLMDILHTELHEIRHAIQGDAIQCPQNYAFPNEMIELWRKNMSQYVEPELDFQLYTMQPVEKDAEQWATEMLMNLTEQLYV